MDALQVWGSIHSDYTIGVKGFSTSWRCPAVKHSSHSQQLPSSPLTWGFPFLNNTQQKAYCNVKMIKICRIYERICWFVTYGVLSLALTTKLKHVFTCCAAFWILQKHLVDTCTFVSALLPHRKFSAMVISAKVAFSKHLFWMKANIEIL